jgi:Dolichyl-phosphate-mannose-protein mannosyltransferase
MTTSELSAPDLPQHRPPFLARVREVTVEGWVLLALVLVAIVIRIITIDNQSFWADEALTAYEAGQSFTAMLHTVASIETTPPLYFVLIWVWAKAFGTSEVALRSISLLAGVALVPIAYLCARELLDRRAGLIAAALVVANPFMIWYSQEARAYMLLTALTGASFLWFLRARRDPSRRNLGWWAGFSAAAVMTHFFAGFAIAPEAVWLLWSARSRATVLAVGVVGAVQVAMLPFAIVDASPSRGAGWIGRISRLHRISQTVIEWGASNLSRGVTTIEGLIVGVTLTLILLILLGLGGDRRTRRAAVAPASVAAFVFLAPLALGFAGEDYFLSRNLIPAFVPVVVLIAAACSAPRAREAGAILAVVLLGIFCFASFDVQTHRYLQRPAWRDVARSLQAGELPRAILAADGTTADPLKIYLPGASWTTRLARPTLIREIDVVGATKRLRLIERAQPLRGAVPVGHGPGPLGAPVPRAIPAPGTRLVARFRVANWVVARFALIHPRRISADQLARMAPHFFRRTPAALLVFFQRPQR